MRACENQPWCAHVEQSGSGFAGFDGAVEHDPQHHEFHLQLRSEIEESRNILLRIIHSLGFRRRRWRETTSKGGQLRLSWQGLSAGKLGLLEALEVLELGIHWQMLRGSR